MKTLHSKPKIIAIFLIVFATALIWAKGGKELDWDFLRKYDGKTIPTEIGKLQKKPVKMPGFMIPLEDEAEMISEFLLVPTPMACIHVPAPPPNQIVHVFMKKNKKVPLIFYEPVWVYGNLTIQKRKNIYASSLYRIDAEDVEIYDPE